MSNQPPSLPCTVTNPKGYRFLSLGTVLGLNLLMAMILARTAWMSSTTFDEAAHFASGIVLAQHSDPGFFRVNPPANKWLIGLAEPLMPTLKLPAVVNSELHGNLGRQEFDFGQQVMSANESEYHKSLFLARLVRIPLMLLGSWMLWISTVSLHRHARLLVQAFWCTSPLILGHGWLVSADAPAGVAMAAILCTALPLLQGTTFRSFIVSGLVWGLAIGTKFTFAPLYLAFPLIIEACRSSTNEKFSGKRAIVCWSSHALIACITLHSLYLFQRPFVPIGQHDFYSSEFRGFRSDRPKEQSTFHRIISNVPSPFPQLFLEGIDQQLTDMNRPRGAYLLGRRWNGPLPWFFLEGFWIKEQPAIPVGLGVGACFVALMWFRRRKKNESEDGRVVDPTVPKHQSVAKQGLILFSFLTLMSIVLLFQSQENLVWNMRYLIPALPAMYILAAESLAVVSTQGWKEGTMKRMISRAPVVIVVVLMIVDLPKKMVHPFSYTSPIFGGYYRNPMALNDSNFDYGQDGNYVASWVEHRMSTIGAGHSIYRIVSGFNRSNLDRWSRVANRGVIEQALKNAKREPRMGGEKRIQTPLVVSRSLFHAEPWGFRYSDFDSEYLSRDDLDVLKELLMFEPDMWITPTLAVYEADDS